MIIKNYIAFTLAEMTLVLLIMSILAAVLTPSITKSISYNAEKNALFSSISSPWKNITTDFPYPGMFFIHPTYNSFAPHGIVSMGYYTNKEPSSYRYPALIIRSKNDSGKSNFYSNPQIAVLYKNGASVTGAPSYKIGVDNNDNTTILSNSFLNPKKTVGQTGNVSSVFIGYAINANQVESYANKSVYIGNYLSHLYGSLNTIDIGYDNSVDRYDSNNVLIGNYIQLKANGKAVKDSVFIGYNTGNNSSAQYDVAIGASAHNNNVGSERNISIGYLAGENGSSTSVSDNISIGALAGWIGITATNSRSQNINIGFSTYGRNQNKCINIGADAGFIASDESSENNIFVGNRAGYFVYGNSNIAIGASAMVNDVEVRPFSNSINIGSQVGNKSYNVDNAILIGADDQVHSMSSDYLSNDAIFIGYIGRNESVALGLQKSIKIGAGDQNLGKWINNVAIGFNACGTANIKNKLCIGTNSGLGSAISGNGYTAWDPSNDRLQAFIGNAYGSNAYANNYITLYAAMVFAPTASPTPLATSDRRLKENIVPSKHSLDDIRKINIYNFNMKGDNEKTPHIGVIAQEHKKIFPLAVVKHPDTKYYTVSAEWMNYTAVNAVKEIDKTVQQLQKSLKEFIHDFLGLKSRVAKLEIKLAQLKKENEDIKNHIRIIQARMK